MGVIRVLDFRDFATAYLWLGGKTVSFCFSLSSLVNFISLAKLLSKA
jgi:hypothetical protein